MCDIYFNFNLILYVVMRSRSYIGMLDCAILRNKYYYYYYGDQNGRSLER